MSDRVTVSMRPLSGTLTISLSHDACDATASAVTVTLTTPAKVNRTSIFNSLMMDSAITKTHKCLPMTEGNMVQLRVLRSLPHRQEVYSLPDRGVRV